MTVSEFIRKNSSLLLLQRTFRLRTATLIMLSVVVAISAIAVKWFIGEWTIIQLFAQLQILQEHPPIWLEVPMDWSQSYLLVPTVILYLMAWVVTKISPQHRLWSRVIIVSILLAVTIRYVLWRSLSTLNLSNPLDGVFSLGLLFMELLIIFSYSFQLYLMLKVKDRRREADRMAAAVIDRIFTPSVDILIPTYDEQDFILRRTIIGCQALDYANKKIYLLDDTKRSEIKQLAKELGCKYITRPDNRHAKAGNLNHALTKTSGELIVVFDADFIPTKNFLTRTVGFFQDEKMALVQTNQSFYNPDPVARNLGLEDVLTEEVEIFSRHYQLLRDGVETAVCYGSSFVVRRSYLEDVGGFVTDSLSEDYFTGIRLVAKGYRFIYLDEKLSAGLAAENIAAHLLQRVRWTRGTLQAFFIDSNPLTIPGLRPIQRLAHFEGLLQWFANIPRVVFLLMPLAYWFLDVIPIRASFAEWLYFFLPYYLLSLITFSWVNKRSRSALLSDLYSVVQCIPLAITAIQVMLNPFSQGFKVTPKGLSRNRYVFNWSLALPLIVLFGVTLFGAWQSLSLGILTPNTGQTQRIEGLVLGLSWSAYNLIILALALLILVDAPKPDVYEWFHLRRVVQLHPQEGISTSPLWGITTAISEGGAEIVLNQIPNDGLPLVDGVPVKLEIMEEGIMLQGKIVCSHCQNLSVTHKIPRLRVMFDSVSLEQQRQLVEMLYCRPDRWQRRETPGELQSLWLLLKTLFRPRVLFDRKPKVSAIAVSQV
jgi:cellulose synthase (UDP-forming)